MDCTLSVGWLFRLITSRYPSTRGHWWSRSYSSAEGRGWVYLLVPTRQQCYCTMITEAAVCQSQAIRRTGCPLRGIYHHIILPIKSKLAKPLPKPKFLVVSYTKSFIRFDTMAAAQGGVNFVKIFFYDGNTISAARKQALVALAYATARNRLLAPKAILIRLVQTFLTLVESTWERVPCLPVFLFGFLLWPIFLSPQSRSAGTRTKPSADHTAN